MTGPVDSFLTLKSSVFQPENSSQCTLDFFLFLIQTQDSPSVFYDVMLDRIFVNEKFPCIVFSSLVCLSLTK